MTKALGFCVCEIVTEIGHRNTTKTHFSSDKKNWQFYLSHLCFPLGDDNDNVYLKLKTNLILWDNINQNLIWVADF